MVSKKVKLTATRYNFINTVHVACRSARRIEDGEDGMEYELYTCGETRLIAKLDLRRSDGPRYSVSSVSPHPIGGYHVDLLHSGTSLRDFEECLRGLPGGLGGL